MAKQNSTAQKKPMIFNSVIMINTENLVSLVKNLPKSEMKEFAFNQYMLQNFVFGGKFHGNDFNNGSHYSTVVRQLGLYHIANNRFFPRFLSDINEETAESYLRYWLKLYVAPNPTSQSIFRKKMSTPKFFLKELITFIENNSNIKNLYDIVDKIYDIEFSRNDKGNLPNIIAKYSDCISVDSDNNVTLKPNYKQVMNDINSLINNPNRFFEHFGGVVKQQRNPQQKLFDYPLQQIYYGAPGTGKSHEINEKTKGTNVIRTTFHPDSDYSTFVGAYKPVMDDVDMKVIPVVLGESGTVFNKNEGSYQEKRIMYKFVKQAFLKAYLLAWKKYANSKCNNTTTNNNDFETSTGGYYIISSVEIDKITLSRKFVFNKKAVSDEWKNLWNGNSFEVPEGPQSGKSVQHAIAKWIYNQINDCSIDSFEEGWTKLMNDINTLGSIDVRKKTTIYNLSRNGNNDEELIVKVEGAGKSRNNLKSIFEGKKSSRKLDNRLVDILKRYGDNFDEAWDKLKDDVRKGVNTDEMEAPNAEVEPQFLVIEEINRGNCAQIFGDLFQLLDRDDIGFSTYPIEADTDLQKAIKIAFDEEEEYQIDGLEIDDAIDNYTSNYDSTLSEDVKEGRVLLLPPNLYIWATMNTSDQSLFPIDSAFKRRWDWVYKPIGYKNNNWTIEIGKKKYFWVDFQHKINEKIYDVDNSEDKQLGDYFVNADRTGGKISAETLLNKILFYIWNDVCKDDPDQIFRWIDDKQEKSIKFSDFFGPDRDEKLQGFMAFHKIPEMGDSTNTSSLKNTEDSEGVKTDTTTEENNVVINA